MKKKKPVQKKFLGGAMLGGMAKDGAIPLMGILPMAYNMTRKKKKKAAADTGNAQGIAAAQRNREIMQAAAARGQKPRKMKSGGKCRGMGAAKRGGDFKIG